MQDEIEMWAQAVAAAVDAVVERRDLAAVKVIAGDDRLFAIPITRRLLQEVKPARKAIEDRWQPQVPLGEAPLPGAADTLQRVLAARPWADTTLPLVQAAGWEWLWALAERHVSEERIVALLGEPLRVTRTRDPTPRSTAELAALLDKHDVPQRLLELAGWGLELIPGDGASRLGGRPELSGPWPLNAAGHALTHLASIALAELPDFDGRDLLPAGGTLVFFGDFHQESEGDEWLVAHLHGGERAAPPQVSLDEYAVAVELPERRIGFRPVLTLPYPDEDADDLDRLDDVEWPTHLLFGHPVFIQGEDPRGAGDVSLLHLGWDEDWGFEYADGGQITFHGPADDIRAGRWDRIQALFESS